MSGFRRTDPVQEAAVLAFYESIGGIRWGRRPMPPPRRKVNAPGTADPAKRAERAVQKKAAKAKKAKRKQGRR